MPSSHIEETLDSALFTGYYREIQIDSKRQMSRKVDKVEISVPWRRELK